jgi:hypothetical protein
LVNKVAKKVAPPVKSPMKKTKNVVQEPTIEEEENDEEETVPVVPKASSDTRNLSEKVVLENYILLNPNLNLTPSIFRSNPYPTLTKCNPNLH